MEPVWEPVHIPLADLKAFLACRTGAFYLFIYLLFFYFLAFLRRAEASAERESRATGGASLPSRVTRACLFCRLAFLDDPLGEGGVFSIHDMTESSCHDAITGYGLDYAGNTPTCFHLLKSLSPFC